MARRWKIERLEDGKWKKIGRSMSAETIEEALERAKLMYKTNDVRVELHPRSK